MKRPKPRAVARINGVAYVLNVRDRLLQRLDDPDDVVEFGDENNSEPVMPS